MERGGEQIVRLQQACDRGNESACSELRLYVGAAVVGAAPAILPAAAPALKTVGVTVFRSTIGPVLGAAGALARVSWDMVKNGWQAIYSHAQELTDRVAPLLDVGGQLTPATPNGAPYGDDLERYLAQHADDVARLERAAARAPTSMAMAVDDAMAARGAAAATQDRIRRIVNREIAPEFDEPFEFFIHGTSDKNVEGWDLVPGKKLFAAVEARTAEIFARRTAGREGGSPSGVVIGLPRTLMDRLRAMRLVRTKEIDDMPGHFETIFEPGAIEFIKKHMVVEPLPPGVFDQ
jgi:hypothetical protein